MQPPPLTQSMQSWLCNNIQQHLATCQTHDTCLTRVWKCWSWARMEMSFTTRPGDNTYSGTRNTQRWYLEQKYILKFNRRFILGCSRESGEECWYHSSSPFFVTSSYVSLFLVQMSWLSGYQQIILTLCPLDIGALDLRNSKIMLENLRAYPFKMHFVTLMLVLDYFEMVHWIQGRSQSYGKEGLGFTITFVLKILIFLSDIQQAIAMGKYPWLQGSLRS